ncbi:rod-binding protein [Rhizobiaceae bacterium BDR2-2]|uniref:Rod-binding protein n=1 Tax=Ectorhizobium quercum TaxID=2965071 RepID=A0AAE3MWB1_9HYPH|nr:rod-binding protein [Ectorhizobium quercum]MCX8996133.1 rod-binding protein [Ectorhizobium quercum]MCX8998828.1 rod-binding protein [Ectorhizobium quercum]
MAISPPSDLVLDVVKAAEPSEIQAAREKLRSRAAGAEATLLAGTGAGFASTVGTVDGAASKAGLGNAHPASASAVPEVYRKFEASVLSTFIQNMLPSESEEVYGKGSAGEFWKSMMAEQMANAVAERGGIGIAEQLFSRQVEQMRDGTPNATTDENDRRMALGSVMDFQRRTLGVGEDEKSVAENT